MPSRDSRIFAVLGPTNTGKTHTAIDRMVSHTSGMIGFPLRLLARENYDKVVKMKGASRVALITGEEKIIPRNPAYFICTVESMPLDRPVEFLAIDEIQLAADPERGHVFTDRLLHARGLEETMLLGADTMRGILRILVPEAEIVDKRRFSVLAHLGVRKLSRLPRRSAVVTFSAQDVYHTAETLRKTRGGTAVVLGALSPRTRNAQVAMYQAGEVDYLVATDAIGMGLNMDIDHVAFARLTKFDGAHPRRLRAHEIAQIAGRAGRHMADGTFGTLPDAGEIDPEIVDKVETHSFDAIDAVSWRSRDLDFAGPQRLLKSLEQRPDNRQLRRARDADDHQALAALVRDPDIRGLAEAGGPAATRLLWDVCQVPDFRKLLSEAHTRLLGDVYRRLMRSGGPDGGSLETDWVADQVKRFDRVDGDIDTLVGRIAHIRTWTYISHRPGWVPDARQWQGATRAIEDRLSDALHDRLTQRFVDRRAAVLTKSLNDGRPLEAAVAPDGSVTVEGHFTGRLDGFVFHPDDQASSDDSKALQTAARKTLKEEIQRRVAAVAGAADEHLSLSDTGKFLWVDREVAKLVAGDDLLKPKIVLIASEDLVESAARDRILTRLQTYLRTRMEAVIGQLLGLAETPPTGPAGGIAFQLVETGGWRKRADVADLIQLLDRDDRRALGRAGIRLGPNHVYIPSLLKPKAVALLALLTGVARGWSLPVPVPPPSIAAIQPDAGLPAARLSRFGYQPCGKDGPAVRLDRLDALAVEAMQRIQKDGMIRHPETLAPLAGLTRLQLPHVLESLGYRPKTVSLPKEKPADAAAPAEGAAPPDASADSTPDVPGATPTAEAGSGLAADAAAEAAADIPAPLTQETDAAAAMPDPAGDPTDPVADGETVAAEEIPMPDAVPAAEEVAPPEPDAVTPVDEAMADTTTAALAEGQAVATDSAAEAVEAAALIDSPTALEPDDASSAPVETDPTVPPDPQGDLAATPMAGDVPEAVGDGLPPGETPLPDPAAAPPADPAEAADPAALASTLEATPSEEAVAAEAAPEMEEVEVWVRQRRAPPNRGPRRGAKGGEPAGRTGGGGDRGGDRGTDRPRGDRPEGAAPGSERPKGGRPDKPSEKRTAEAGGEGRPPRKPNKPQRDRDRGPRRFESSGPAPAPEDSPFAALAALKPKIEQAAKQKGNKGKK